MPLSVRLDPAESATGTTGEDEPGARRLAELAAKDTLDDRVLPLLALLRVVAVVPSTEARPSCEQKEEWKNENCLLTPDSPSPGSQGLQVPRSRVTVPRCHAHSFWTCSGRALQVFNRCSECVYDA